MSLMPSVGITVEALTLASRLGWSRFGRRRRLEQHKSLQQFFKYLLEEEEIDRSPMERLKQPQTPQKLVSIMGDDDTKKLLDSTKGQVVHVIAG